MAEYGFIHDQLEIKFLILYLTARLIEPVSFDQILDLSMCDDGVEYFSFSESLADLVKTGHLQINSEDLYSITEKGMRNSRICETSLPYSVRLRCDKNLSIVNRALRRKSQIRAATETRPNGTYAVRLMLDDDLGSVMNLNLMVPREDLGQMIAERFKSEPEQYYSRIIDLFLTEDEA